MGHKKIEIKGIKLNEEGLEQLQELKMKIDGTIKITTKAKVLKHNARSKPSCLGFLGGYKWQFKSIDDPAPYMLIQLK